MATSTKRTRRQDTVITILLILAGIALAICLFAAGFLWRSHPVTQSA